MQRDRFVKYRARGASYVQYSIVVALVIAVIAGLARVYARSQAEGAGTLAGHLRGIDGQVNAQMAAPMTASEPASFTTPAEGAFCDAMGCRGVAKPAPGVGPAAEVKPGPGPGVVAGEAKPFTPAPPPLPALEQLVSGNTLPPTATPRERFGHLVPSPRGFIWRFGDRWNNGSVPRMTGADHAELARLQGLTLAAENAAAEAQNEYARAWQAAYDSSTGFRRIIPFVDSPEDYATNHVRGGAADRARARANAAVDAARAAEAAHIRAAQARFDAALRAVTLPANAATDFIAMTPDQRNELMARMTSAQFHALADAIARLPRPAEGPQRAAYDEALARLRNPVPPQLAALIAQERANRQFRGESAEALAQLLTAEDHAALWAGYADERAQERESEALAAEWRAAAAEDFVASRRALQTLQEERERIVREFNTAAGAMPPEIRRNLGTGNGSSFQSYLEQDFEWRIFYSRDPDGSIRMTGRFVPRPETELRILRQALSVNTMRHAPVMEIGTLRRHEPFVAPTGPMQILYYRLNGRSEVVVPSRSYGHMRSVLFEDVITVYTTVTGVAGLVRAGGMVWVGTRATATLAERQLAVQAVRRVGIGIAVGEVQRNVVNQLIPGNDPRSQEARFWLNFTLSSVVRVAMTPRQPRSPGNARPATQQPTQQPAQQPATTPSTTNRTPTTTRPPNTNTPPPTTTPPATPAPAPNGRTPLFVRQSCFVAGTSVLVACDAETMACGEKRKPIEDVRIGDMVFAVDETTHVARIAPVTRTTRRTTDALRGLSIATDHGVETIQTTDEHPFFVGGVGFVAAKSLEHGSRLEGADGEAMIVEDSAARAIPGGVEVFNLTIAEAHTYYVAATANDAPVLVHNADQCSLDDIFTGVRSPADIRAAAELARGAGMTHTPQAVAARVVQEMNRLNLNAGQRAEMNRLIGGMTDRDLRSAYGAALSAPPVVSVPVPAAQAQADVLRSARGALRDPSVRDMPGLRLDHTPNQPGPAGLPNVQVGPVGSPGLRIDGTVRAEGWRPPGWPADRPLTPEALMQHPTLGAQWRIILPLLQRSGFGVPGS